MALNAAGYVISENHENENVSSNRRKRKTNKNKIYYPNARVLPEYVACGVKKRQKNTYSSALFATDLAHIFWFNHFGASTLFVIYSETIEHETTE